MTPVIGSAMAEPRTKTGAARRARDIARSDTGARGTATTARAGARAATQLVAVMLASNVVMVTIRHLVSHETKPLFTLAWWWQFLVLGTEWSISGILLPIALFLLISPALIRVLDAGRSRLHAVMIAAAVTLCTGAAWSVRAVAGE